MESPYTKNAATYSQDAKEATLVAVHGDTFEAALDAFVEHPSPYVPGEVIRHYVDMSTLSWDSSITDGAQEIVGAFTIVDAPLEGNRIYLRLSAAETRSLTPGTYRYWLESLNLNTGVTRTWIRGTLTITEKP